MGKTVEQQGDGTLATGAEGNRVHFLMGKVINLGNYESFRVEVGYTRVVGDKSHKAVLKQIKKQVQTELDELVEAIEEARDA